MRFTLRIHLAFETQKRKELGRNGKGFICAQTEIDLPLL